MSTPSRLAVAVLSVLPFLLAAQNVSPDSSKNIEREILSQPDTDNEIIAKSREMIGQRLQAGDVAKVTEIVSYLDSRFAHRRVLPLLPFERFLIAYWTRQYGEILNPALLDTLESSRYSNWLFPPNDMLFDEIREDGRDHRVSLKGAIMASSVSDADKDFLTLFLDFILTEGTYEKPDEELNRSADEFLATRRDSPYAGYVRQHIRFVIRESDWGYAFDLGLGTTNVGGNLSYRFKDGIGLGLGVDVAKRRLLGPLDIVGYFRFIASLGNDVRREFTYNGTWHRDLALTTLIPEFSLGVVALDNSWIQVAPFAGISGILVAPPEEDKKIPGNDVSLDMFSYTIGLNADWKLGQSSIPVISRNENSYWFIRTRLTYTAPTSAPTPEFRGSVIAITVSVGVFGRPMYRDL